MCNPKDLKYLALKAIKKNTDTLKGRNSTIISFFFALFDFCFCFVDFNLNEFFWGLVVVDWLGFYLF